MTPMDGSNPKGDARLAAAVLGAEDAVDPRDLPPVMLGPDSTARIDASLARATCPACGSARPTNGGGKVDHAAALGRLYASHAEHGYPTTPTAPSDGDGEDAWMAYAKAMREYARARARYDLTFTALYEYHRDHGAKIRGEA